VILGIPVEPTSAPCPPPQAHLRRLLAADHSVTVWRDGRCGGRDLGL